MATVTNIQATVLVATAAVLSLTFGENNLIPSKMYKYRPALESKYSWEDENRYLFSSYKEILDKYQIIHMFASKLSENSEELEPSIVQFVSENFWKLI